MGTVGVLATHHLLRTLRAEPMAMIPERDFFQVSQVEVHHGVARSGPLPRSMFFLWRDPRRRHDLVLFVGEAQPESGGYRLCRRVVDFADRLGVDRVVTFAAMASQIHPGREARVFGAVTAPRLLPDLRDADVHLLADGHISGLNGALLAAAAERDIPAVCLLGEMPFFAVTAPNPKPAAAVLEVFSRLSGIPVALDALDEQSAVIEPQLVELFEQLDEELGLGDEEDEEGWTTGDEEDDDEEEQAPAAPDPVARLTDVDRARIERLFESVRGDRRAATRLRDELVRLDVFEHYEDRFLDLFRPED
jgi:proteasome assembly chaperone (PAC2) family protein